MMDRPTTQLKMIGSKLMAKLIKDKDQGESCDHKDLNCKDPDKLKTS